MRITILLFIGCSAPIAEQPHLSLDRATRTLQLPVQIGGRLAKNPRWEPQATDLLEETKRVIQSYRFEEILVAHADLHVSRSGPTISGRALFAAYLGLQSGRAIAATQIKVASGVKEGVPGVTLPCKTEIAGAKVNIRIQPYVLRQWASNSLESRACAINTLAHELTHAVLGDDGEMFTDGGCSLSHRALVSYTVGSIAQCVYLQAHGVFPSSAIEACISRSGTATFAGCEHPKSADDGLDALGQPACSP